MLLIDVAHGNDVAITRRIGSVACAHAAAANQREAGTTILTRRRDCLLGGFLCGEFALHKPQRQTRGGGS